MPARLDEHVLERIVVETRGNPLALLELPRGLTPTQLAGGFGLPAAVPLSASIEESFTRRLASLPGDARRLLLVAAADPVGDPALVWRAAQQLGIPESVAETVEAEGLLELGARVVFRHPLVRSAVYRAAGLKRAPRCPPRPGGSNRSGDRSGSPRLAPGAGGINARRGRRRRARALRWTGAGARRVGGCRRVPRARRRAHTRVHAPRAASARGRRREARCRRSGGCARAVGRRRGRSRSTSSGAPGSTSCEPRSRWSSGAAATPAACF